MILISIDPGTHCGVKRGSSLLSDPKWMGNLVLAALRDRPDVPVVVVVVERIGNNEEGS